MFVLDVAETKIRWLPAMAAACLWGLAVGSAALWSLQMPRSEGEMAVAAAVAPGVSDALAVPDHGGVARALGHRGESKATGGEPRRFQLQGVIAAPAGRGSALLAVDGQLAQAFVQGQTVAHGWRLERVRPEGVRLSAGDNSANLELALPVKP